MPRRKRDPRINPQPGDVLRKKYQGQYFESRAYMEREVFDVDDGKVTYVGTHCCSPTVLLASWRRWAKDAEVIATKEGR